MSKPMNHRFTQRHSCFLMMGLAAAVCTGCATTSTSNTARTGTEQILISSAIDRAMSTVRFSDFAGYKVFIDDKYLDGAVDKGYLVGSLRHKVLAAGGSLAAAADAADVVLEARSGGIGTDSQESFLGMPAIGVPGLPIELPEVKIASRDTQMGTAKIGLVCYDPKTGRALGTGGQANALAHNNDTYVLGIGPFRSGAVVDARENAAGFNGVGGTLMGSTKALKRHQSIAMVDRLPAEDPYSEANPNPEPQIATLPEGTNIK